MQISVFCSYSYEVNEIALVDKRRRRDERERERCVSGDAGEQERGARWIELLEEGERGGWRLIK